MIRFTLRVDYNRRALAWLLCLVTVVALAGVALPRGPSGEVRAEQVQAYLPDTAGRHLYLTDANYYPDEALTACAAGYHMASLWEILDVSNLVYDYDHPAAHTKADSGNGPPSFWNGWVRTGNTSSNSNVTGTGNCLAWTSRSAADYGVTVRLSRTWVTAPGDIFSWDATSWTCSTIGPVWCIGDFYRTYLPAVLRN